MTPFYPYRSRRRYKDGKGGNANEKDTWIVKAEAFGKCRSENSPYLIANEWIAAQIGHFLRLPVPPCTLLRKKSASTVMFSTQSFEGDTTPDDTKPAVLYSEFPHLCAGILVFDILIANRDRGKWNIKVDDPDHPTLIRLIDHERALFYVYPKEGIKELKSREDRLGLTQSSYSNNFGHCLLQVVKSTDDLAYWVKRVSEMPDAFIETVCREAKSIAITEVECVFISEFLKKRRDNLGDLILNHKLRFPLVKSWPLFLIPQGS